MNMAEAYLERKVDQDLAHEEEFRKALVSHYKQTYPSNLFNGEPTPDAIYVEEQLLNRFLQGFTQIALKLPVGHYSKILWYNDTPVFGVQAGEQAQFIYQNDKGEWITATFTADLKESKVYVGHKFLIVVYGRVVQWASWDTGETWIKEVPNAASSENNGDVYFAVGTVVYKYDPENPEMELVLTCDHNITKLLIHDDVVYAADDGSVHVWSLSKETKETTFKVGDNIIDMCVSGRVLYIRTNSKNLLIYGNGIGSKKLPNDVTMVCSCRDGTFFWARHEQVVRYDGNSMEEARLPYAILDMSVSQSGKLGVLAHGHLQQFVFVNEVGDSALLYKGIE